MIGEVITFGGQEYKVLAHKGDYVKVIELDRPYPLTKLLPFNKIYWPDSVINNIQIEDLWTNT
jgi:hypothetical protein